jgi:pimeloyl-ACP methyl ester carboxylesterase
MTTDAGWSHREARVNGVRLHVVEAGRGAPVVLLHGFPEFWYSWRKQLPPLAGAGFRALAPDLRGYNESDAPTGVRNYRATVLVNDVAALIREVAGKPACVVGHDWGGVLAWKLAAVHPELVQKLAILNTPHPAAYFRELARNPRQWLRSWYVLFFQLPWLPERCIRAGDFKMLERTWRRFPQAFTDEDIAAYKATLGKPGRLTGPVNYYRAALRYPRDGSGGPQTIRVPTLLIWGERDPYLATGLSEGLERWVPHLRVERLPDAGHWVQNEVPDRVNRLLIDFFGSER